MQKSHVLAYPVSDLIKNRRSVRSFSGTPVEAEKIRSLFEATRWAPSSTNEQPWVYLYASKEQPELWNKLLDCLNEGNKTWAKEAPLLIFSMARKRFARYNTHNAYALYDLGGANSFLAIQAVELGLQVRQMAGYHRDKVLENLRVPEDYSLGVFIAVGYPASSGSFPDALKQREEASRERFVQEEFVMNRVF